MTRSLGTRYDLFQGPLTEKRRNGIRDPSCPKTEPETYNLLGVVVQGLCGLIYGI